MNEPIVYNQKGEECYKLGISLLFITNGSRILLRVPLMLKLAVGHRDHLLLSLIFPFLLRVSFSRDLQMRNSNLGDSFAPHENDNLLFI
jgi:hypothetical protein